MYMHAHMDLAEGTAVCFNPSTCTCMHVDLAEVTAVCFNPSTCTCMYVDLAEVTAVCFNPSTCTCMHTWTWLRSLLYVLILLHVHACTHGPV